MWSMKKEQVIKIAENLRDTFRERLKNNRWLSGTTKIKAIEKLGATLRS